MPRGRPITVEHLRSLLPVGAVLVPALAVLAVLLAPGPVPRSDGAAAAEAAGGTGAPATATNR